MFKKHRARLNILFEIPCINRCWLVEKMIWFSLIGERAQKQAFQGTKLPHWRWFPPFISGKEEELILTGELLETILHS